MSDEGRAKFLEGRVAEDVVRMFVRVDDVEDRLRGPGANRGEEPSPYLDAAARVDDGDALIADNEADVGDIAEIVLAHERDGAGVSEHAGRDFVNGERIDGLRPSRNDQERQDQAEKNARQVTHVRSP